MNEITISEMQLPDTLPELASFVLVGREKLTAVRAEIRAIEKVGLAKEVYEQKLKEAQEVSEIVTDAEVKIGRLIDSLPKATRGTGANQHKKAEIDNAVDFSKRKSEAIAEAGLTQKQAERFQTLAQNTEIVEEAKAEARENNDIVSRSTILKKIKAKKKAEEVKQAQETVASETRESENRPVLTVGNGIGFVPNEKYNLLLTDPPYSTDVDNISEFVGSWLYTALDGVRKDGFAYVFIGAYPDELRAYLNAQIPKHMKLEQVLIWTYKNTLGNNPKNRYKQNYQACLFYRGIEAPDLNCPLTSEQWAVQEINAPDGRQHDRFHAWQKPMEIAERFIRHSTAQDMTVFDPFSCTGTFLIAAAKLGRKAYGFEINPDNAEIAFTRGCVREQICV